MQCLKIKNVPSRRVHQYNKKELIFIEDEELKYKSKQLASKIWKPNPYSLLKALNKDEGELCTACLTSTYPTKEGRTRFNIQLHEKSSK